MKIEGKIKKVVREESGREGKPAIYTTAEVEFPKGKDLVAVGLLLYGFEPEVVFSVGQKVTIEVEGVA